jgi:hypothetical protein
MWVYNIKSDLDGDVSCYKARFVTKGCSKREGLEYTETFSHVIRMASLRLFLAISAATNLELCQFDIDTAFLYVHLKEVVYIRLPLGFADGSPEVCHLKRCLYGLKQSPREFNTLLRDWLVEHGWKHCMSDRFIYTFRTDDIFAMIMTSQLRAVIQHICMSSRQPSEQELRLKTWVTSLKCWACTSHATGLPVLFQWTSPST